MWRFIFGRDIFISYARLDSSTYSMALGSRLAEMKFTCFLDQYTSIPNQNIPPKVWWALKRSSMLVVVVSEKARNSVNVRKEVETFRSTQRPIVPIIVGNSLLNEAFDKSLEGVAIEPETVEALASGMPSRHVFERIKAAATFTKQTNRLQKLVVSSLALFVVLAVAIPWLTYNLADKAVQLKTSTEILTETRREIIEAGQNLEQVSVNLAGTATLTSKIKGREADALVAALIALDPWVNRWEKAPLEIVHGLVDAVRAGRNNQIIRGLVTVTPDGAGLVTASKEELTAWEFKSGRRLGMVKPKDGVKTIHPNFTRLSIDCTVLTAIAGNAVVRWSIESGVELPGFDHTKGFYDPVISPDGNCVGMISRNELRLWSTTSGQVLWSAKLATPDRIEQDRMDGMHFLRQGQSVALLDGRTLRVWESQSGQETATVPQVDGPALALANDGSLLIAGKSREKAKYWEREPALLWKRSDRPSVVRLSSLARNVVAADWSSWNHLFATADPNGNWRVWNTNALLPPIWLKGEKSVFGAGVLFSADGLRLAGGAEGVQSAGEVKIWAAMTGKELCTIPGDLLTIHADSERVITADRWSFKKFEHWREDLSEHLGRIVDTWSELEGTELHGVGDPFVAVSLLPDGSKAAGMTHSGAVWLMDAHSGRIIQQLGKRPVGPPPSDQFWWGFKVEVSPDGRYLAGIDGDPDTRFQVWNLDTGQKLVLAGVETWVADLSFSGTAPELLVGWRRGRAEIWNLGGEAPTARVLAGPLSEIRWLAWSPDGRRVAGIGRRRAAMPNVNSYDREPYELMVWDASDGKLKFSVIFPKGKEPMEAPRSIGPVVSFSPDGARLVTAGRNSTDIWNAQDGRHTAEFSATINRYVETSSFSADGKRLMSLEDGDHMFLWDGRTHAKVQEISNAGGWAQWSPDGYIIASVSQRGTLTLFDGYSGRQFATMRHGPENEHLWVHSLSFSSDGRRVATVDGNGKVIVWRLPRPLPRTVEGLGREACMQLRWRDEFSRISGRSGLMKIINVSATSPAIER